MRVNVKENIMVKAQQVIMGVTEAILDLATISAVEESNDALNDFGVFEEPLPGTPWYKRLFWDPEVEYEKALNEGRIIEFTDGSFKFCEDVHENDVLDFDELRKQHLAERNIAINAKELG